MNKIVSYIIKIIIILLFVFTWRTVQAKSEQLDITYMYLYLALAACSLTSDKLFYKGQKTENRKMFQNTSHFLALTWFALLILPMLEYAYTVRYNIVITLIGAMLIFSGIIIRGIGIKTLGKFFSRDVETWENQTIIKIGIYKYIRHPAYAGNMLQVIGFPLFLNSYISLILSLITIGGFLWRIIIEEKVLIDKYPDYKEYTAETKRIIPKVW